MSDFRPQRFEPRKFGEELRRRYDAGERHFLTLLVGAGFSRSAGIPTAGEIVAELEREDHPLLRGIDPPPPGISQYAHWMHTLGSPKERSDRVKKAVNGARDKEGRLKINWAHLLLAALAEAEVLHRVLTVNFDPLIVEALSLARVPIRTFDLNAAGRFQPRLLDPGSVIYLHGQMHNLLLANSMDELAQLEKLYEPVLQEAVEKRLLVIGYSGECDPVLHTLARQILFPDGIRWVHFSSRSAPPCADIQDLFTRHAADCQLCEGLDADRFMMQFVLEGMRLPVPRIVAHPFEAAIERLLPIQEIPEATGPAAPDVVRRARGILEKARDEANQLKLEIELASLGSDEELLQRLALRVQADPESEDSRALGTGFLRAAQARLKANHIEPAIPLLESAERWGTVDSVAGWLPNSWGYVFQAQAQNQTGPEAERLFGLAGQKFEQALQIKPDMHEALYNWGTALGKQAKTQSGPEAERLFALAGQKCEEALRIKPDDASAFFNLACLEALRDQALPCTKYLEKWRLLHPQPTRTELDNDSDFDKVRDTPEFRAFLDSLPEA